MPSSSRTDSMSSMRSPNTVPWPHPVVAVRFSVFLSRSTRPLRVLTAPAFTSAPLPDPRDRLDERVIATAGSRQRLQVVAALREKAGVELPVGGQSCARARGAERLRHRGDHADFAAAVEVAPALHDFAGVVGLD